MYVFFLIYCLTNLLLILKLFQVQEGDVIDVGLLYLFPAKH